MNIFCVSAYIKIYLYIYINKDKVIYPSNKVI